jgi:hypothetical protein
MGLDLVAEVNQRPRRYGSQSGPGLSTSPPALGAGDSRTPDKFRADMLHLNPMGYDRLASALYRALDGFENRLQKPTRKLAPKARIDAPASRWLMADEAAALRRRAPTPE